MTDICAVVRSSRGQEWLPVLLVLKRDSRASHLASELVPFSIDSALNVMKISVDPMTIEGCTYT